MKSNLDLVESLKFYYERIHVSLIGQLDSCFKFVEMNSRLVALVDGKRASRLGGGCRRTAASSWLLAGRRNDGLRPTPTAFYRATQFGGERIPVYWTSLYADHYWICIADGHLSIALGMIKSRGRRRSLILWISITTWSWLSLACNDFLLNQNKWIDDGMYYSILHIIDILLVMWCDAIVKQTPQTDHIFTIHFYHPVFLLIVRVYSHGMKKNIELLRRSFPKIS